MRGVIWRKQCVLVVKGWDALFCIEMAAGKRKREQGTRDKGHGTRNVSRSHDAARHCERSEAIQKKNADKLARTGLLRTSQ
jgi:hypothetical protein